MLSKINSFKLKFKVKEGVCEEIYDGYLSEMLPALEDGNYVLVVNIIDNKVDKAKKKYFSMVSELAEYAGYVSRKEKDQFKEAVKKELGNESIAEMITFDEIKIKLEELHKLAAEHYNYIFKPYNPDE